MNGTHKYKQVDFKTYGQIPINWEWCWSSNHSMTGSLGNRIHFSYDSQLTLDRQYGELFYRDFNGNEYLFPWIFEGEESLDRMNKLLLTAEKDSFTVEDLSSGFYYSYSRSQLNRDCFLLNNIRNAAGYVLTITRNELEQLLQLTDSNQVCLEVEYNHQGFIQSLTLNKSQIVGYSYSSEGDLLEVTDSLGISDQFVYDVNHLMKERKIRNGATHHWDYDQDGRLIHQWVDGGLDECWFEYDELQQKNCMRDFYGNETSYHYNDFGLIERINHYQGGTERFFYNEQLQLIEERAVDGQVTQYVYDQNGLLTNKIYNDGTTEQFDYNLFGKKIQVADRKGSISTYEYNEENLLTRAIENDIEIFNAVYKKNNNLMESSIIKGQTNQYFYDQYGRIIRKISSEGKEEYLWEYNQFGQCIHFTKIQSQKNIEYFCSYDSKQRLISIRQGEKIIREYTYNLAGLISMFSVNGQRLNLEYDAGNRIISLQTPVKDRYDFYYNRLGDILEVKRNNKQIYFAERNQARQIVKEVYEKEFEKRFDYDQIGRVHKVTLGNGIWTKVNYDSNGYIDKMLSKDKTWEIYEYDSFGNIIIAKNFCSELHLSYNSQNQLIQEKVVASDDNLPDTMVNYDYFRDNMLKNRSILGILTESYERTAAGYKRTINLIDKQQVECELYKTENETTIQVGDIQFKSKYDPEANRTTKTVISKESANHFDYEYIGSKQLKRVRNELENQITVFDYDEKQRLINVSENGSELLRRFYDQSGMRQIQEGYNLKTDSVGRVIEKNQTRYVYDVQGNLVEKRIGDKLEVFSYTASGQLIVIDSTESGKSLFFYDCLGRLFLILREDSVQHFIWSKDQLCLEIYSLNKQPTQITQWLYGSYEDSGLILAVDNAGNKNCYFEHDGQGYLSLNSDKRAVSQEKSSSKGRFQLKRIRQTGLAYRRFRLLDEETNRFIQRSPLHQFSIFSDNYETNTNQKVGFSLEENQAFENQLLQESGMNARMKLIRLMVKDRHCFASDKHESWETDVFDVENLVENELLGLDEFGILTVEQLINSTIQQRLDNYLNRDRG
ncbi:DUF6531 domain-containing protein [Enterococcus sp. BWB1-3]|uniref:DUF6531 domain-containing protein n=1 Tax=Enterococcus sp. BWB1-3 TaxID=2787713 RepID=UPI002ED1838A